MATLNKFMGMGNLTRDVELRYTPQGKAVCTLGVAINRNYKGKDGEKKQDTCFVNVVAWNQLAEICNQYLQKGRPVFIEGRLQSRNWQDQEGKNRSVVEVVADNVQFLGSPQQASTSEEEKDTLGKEAQAVQDAFEEEVIIPGEEEMY